MKFGIHSSWLGAPNPAEAFEAVKAKAQWAEQHGFVWFSVMDHTIQIPRVGAPDEPACNVVGSDPAEVRHKLDVLRRHCDAAGRPRTAGRLRRDRVRGH